MTEAPALLLNQARPREDAVDAVDATRELIECGWDGVSFADSPGLFPDPWVETERVLSATSVSLAGPCVAALGLRHPATVAGALRTLAGHHPGRAIAVVGRGESSVLNEGLAVPSLRDYVSSLRRLRALLAEDGDLAAPILGAASGPRTITASSNVLGGVLLDVGVHPGVISRAVELARRDGSETTVWLFVRAVVTTTDSDAAAAAEPLIGSCAARLVGAPEWFGVPPDKLEAVRKVADSHDYRRHGTASARSGSVSDADRLVRERFLLAGSGAQIRAHLRPLAGIGISGVIVAGAVRGVTDRLSELAAALREGLQSGARA